MNRFKITKLREIADEIGIENVQGYNRHQLLELIEKYQDDQITDEEFELDESSSGWLANLPSEILDLIIQQLPMDDRIQFLRAYPEFRDFAKFWIDGPILFTDLEQLVEDLDIPDVEKFNKVELIDGPLDVLPPEYQKLSRARNLLIGGQEVSVKINWIQIYEIPKNLRWLQNLHTVIISNPNLTHFPIDVLELRALRVLKIENARKITFLPPNLIDLKFLTTLEVPNMGISSIPFSFQKWTSLEFLDLSGTKLINFPTHLPPRLQKLNILGTSINRSEIPKHLQSKVVGGLNLDDDDEIDILRLMRRL